MNEGYVKIIKASGKHYWYADKVGEVYKVSFTDQSDYEVHHIITCEEGRTYSGGYINRDDAISVNPPIFYNKGFVLEKKYKLLEYE